jgi:hypothetical protein
VRSRAEVSADKLRGGFYTPPGLVDHCLERVCALVDRDRAVRVLEPGAGDGAFVHGLGRSVLRARVERIMALEPLQGEADKTLAAIAASALPGEVRRASAVRWAAGTDEQYDVAVGNPPFVRYQFVSSEDRASALDLARRLGVALSGVSNLWIPVLIGGLSRLAPGGVFAFVVPTECLTGVSAGVLRAWVLSNFERLQFDHFAPGSFPGVLQEVGVLSGRRAPSPQAGACLRLVEHDREGCGQPISHMGVTGSASWTRYLLDEPALQALSLATGASAVKPLGEIARFEVSIVTGANDFFSVSDHTLAACSLEPWARPLLPRIRHAPGLILTAGDVQQAARAGARAHLLDFSSERPDPRSHPPARAYLEDGEARGLPARYKCRIREPWFRVPGIRQGSLLLSKRSHRYPRVIVNQAGVFTTDTIYRGEVCGAATPAGVASAFHNSLTLLDAELEGRTFGGGVLELVPSEIARLAFPVIAEVDAQLQALDRIARALPADALVRATDALVGRAAGIEQDVLAALAGAREQLRDRRLARNPREQNGQPAATRAGGH